MIYIDLPWFKHRFTYDLPIGLPLVLPLPSNGCLMFPPTPFAEADWYDMPHDVLARISNRIINEAGPSLWENMEYNIHSFFGTYHLTMVYNGK